MTLRVFSPGRWPSYQIFRHSSQLSIRFRISSIIDLVMCQFFNGVHINLSTDKFWFYLFFSVHNNYENFLNEINITENLREINISFVLDGTSWVKFKIHLANFTQICNFTIFYVLNEMLRGDVHLQRPRIVMN